MTIEQLPQWRRERNAALIAFDRAYFRNMAISLQGAEPDPVVLETAIHKSRYQCADLPPDVRHASSKWLRDRGFGALEGELLPEGLLP